MDIGTNIRANGDLWPKQANKEKLTQYYSYKKHRPGKLLVASAKDRAKSRGLKFNISEKDIVIPEFCPYLKVPMVVNTMYAPSVDRIDPTKGYIKGNIEIISRKANIMKSNASVSELLEFAYTILDRH